MLLRATFIVLLTLIVARAAPAEPSAQEARRELLDVLVQNGFLTRPQADSLATPAPRFVVPATKAVTRLSLGGRIQTQFVSLSATQDNAPDPSSVNHFLLRRVYLTAKADLGPDWRANLTYNFANSLFDIATVQWVAAPSTTVDIGYRMVNLGREQRLSSGVLKAIERSAATRYFVESNNGTRLGAGSYRVGVFADGTVGDVFWGAALTNPEQPTTTALAAAPGTSANNRPAFWLNGGLDRKTSVSRLVLGTGIGWLPDQGGRVVGTGEDLFAGTLYADYTRGRFNLLAEFLGAHNPGGAADGSDALILGGFIQPSWSFTKQLEGVARIGYLDTDGRGVTLRDALPSAPATLANNRVWDAYLGGTWYFQGNDLKLQAGLTYALGEDTPAGASAKAESYGLRSQMQINF
jgi:hypothetical protein